MSDMEEPPSKLLKFESQDAMNCNDSIGSQENGQEEWLSEGVLTDDDYNPMQDHDNSNFATSQDESNLLSMNEASFQNSEDATQETRLNADRSKDSTLDSKDLPGELGMFLTRKADGRVKKDSDSEESKKSDDDDEDDGNNTDELLRMLGEGINKEKSSPVLKLKDNKKNAREESSDDEDDNIFEGVKMKTVRLAKNAVMKRMPIKMAKPEKMSDSEMSSDNESSKQKVTKTTRKLNVAAKSTSKSASGNPKNLHKTGSGNIERTVKNDPKTFSASKYAMKVLNANQQKNANKNTPRVQFNLEKETKAVEEVIKKTQAISKSGNARETELMAPEQMDEEMFTDEDSEMSDGSFYDEFPSSESEDIEDWFALDIRAERAGDYLPLLGNKAVEMLTEEKKRVIKKLSTLRESIASLSEKSKDQTNQIEEARRHLSEIDILLTHT